jgi:hypothetical protein
VAGYFHGIQPTGRVLLYLGNSFHHFAAAFGAWRAGWGTIPMDPRYPSARNRQILEDADPDHVLTDPDHLDDLRSFCDLPIEARAIDQFGPVSRQDLESIGKEVGPESPSSILFPPSLYWAGSRRYCIDNSRFRFSWNTRPFEIWPPISIDARPAPATLDWFRSGPKVRATPST